ncbi:phosphomevalonate kinase [Corynebacterium sphenisci]|uniref:phosphomevalonate kinase n=1 Tax=Corynebacterium sphenisci TaxID=191493 RepID=UPI0026E0D955|nr:phosphomevalonate kinase [Corynebacterium sphenisci]MDO5730467.1 phosphomevalonate kinase [Corynebacterium sphenisci]
MARPWPAAPAGAAGFGAACGKLYLAGEYAVMTPGATAVILGVDRHLTAAAYPAAGEGGEVRSAQFAAPRRYRLGPDGAVDAPGWADDLVAAALAVGHGLAARAGAGARPLRLEISSGLDDAATGRKYGLGSSGAVTIAVIQAVARAHGLDPAPGELYRAGVLAALRAGAAGSAGDLACAAFGGVVRYTRPEPAALAALSHAGRDLGALARPWPGLALETMAWPAGIGLAVGWTGSPAATGAQLAAAGRGARAADAADFPAAMGAAAEGLWAALGAADAAAAAAPIRRARALLAGYAADRGIVIETPALARLADAAEARGWAAKSSGAGGGDCGIALGAADPAAAAALRQDWAAAGIAALNAAPCPPRAAGQ